MSKKDKIKEITRRTKGQKTTKSDRERVRKLTRDITKDNK